MWYLVLRRPVKSREEWTVTLDQHLLWMKQQHESGKILFSGPTTDRKYGVYVIRAGSKDEAEKIAAREAQSRKRREEREARNARFLHMSGEDLLALSDRDHGVLLGAWPRVRAVRAGDGRRRRFCR